MRGLRRARALGMGTRASGGASGSGLSGTATPGVGSGGGDRTPGGLVLRQRVRRRQTLMPGACCSREQDSSKPRTWSNRSEKNRCDKKARRAYRTTSSASPIAPADSLASLSRVCAEKQHVQNSLCGALNGQGYVLPGETRASHSRSRFCASKASSGGGCGGLTSGGGGLSSRAVGAGRDTTPPAASWLCSALGPPGGDRRSTRYDERPRSSTPSALRR